MPPLSASALLPTILVLLSFGVSIPAETLHVAQAYDPEGNLREVTRWSIPDTALVGRTTTRREYDLADRLTTEIAPDSKIDSTYYDEAGNVIRHADRNATALHWAGVTMTYDALGRLRTRTTPGNISGPSSGVVSPFPQPFPLYAITGHPDVAEFTYDGDGNMLTADNQYAHILRTYYLKLPRFSGHLQCLDGDSRQEVGHEEARAKRIH